MKKVLFFLAGILFLFIAPNTFAADYTINNFQSQIEIQKDTTLLVKEKLDVNFSVEKHGIFRDIPIIYTNNGKTINIRLKVLSVKDEKGGNYKYHISKKGNQTEIKIGDPEKLISGSHTYIITYQASGVVQQFEDHDELYWNAFGSAWDTIIKNGDLTVTSQFANITNTKCFYGAYGSTNETCQISSSENLAKFTSPSTLGIGQDMTIVVALGKNNSLIFPSTTQKILMFASDNWGYLFTILPALYMIISWYKKGRDKRYLSENVYFEPKDKTTKTVSLFERKFLPMVYSPVGNLTPSEIGTIIDERVDIRDVVAEIAELARLKYLKIEVIKTKKLLSSKTDYIFTSLNKNKNGLRNYQKYLFEKLFVGGNETKLSDLKNTFYVYLSEFKKELYKDVYENGYFDQSPDKTRLIWFTKWLLSCVFSTVVIQVFYTRTGNFGPFVFFGILDVISLPIVYFMPQKTAKGYQIHRQAKGLAFYIKKGKWREEVSEKNLFFEEMLPLAISLGVVKRLASDMKDLGAKPPSYIHGTSSAFIYSNLGSFDTKLGSTLSSSPHASGGGSGFSGGSSGGGFGGGGGGSW